MWKVEGRTEADSLDGRQTKIEALGLRLENRGGAAPVFGPIPDRLYHEFENESDKDSDEMLRLELTEAAFERSHKVFETWNEYARTAKLPHNDPYLNGMEFRRAPPRISITATKSSNCIQPTVSQSRRILISGPSNTSG